MKYIKLIIAVLITGIAIYIYSGFFGNPIEYLKVKHAFEDYIDKNYDGKLEIEADRKSTRLNSSHSSRSRMPSSA